jgi:hypothetical protein
MRQASGVGTASGGRSSAGRRSFRAWAGGEEPATPWGLGSERAELGLGELEIQAVRVKKKQKLRIGIWRRGYLKRKEFGGVGGRREAAGKSSI